MLEPKGLPDPSFKLVFQPESDTEYKHFESAIDLPFDFASTAFSRVNAWWLADAALLSYWDEDRARERFHDLAGLESALIQSGNRKSDTQCYAAWNGEFTLVAFRGTEPDSLLDILADARIKFTQWDGLQERVHIGFRDALDAVWTPLLALLKGRSGAPVWFTGHSLGAALATLAADRFARMREAEGLGELRGVYTFGSPLVGDRAFVDGYNTRTAARSFRFVNDQDSVTRVPFPLLGYRHVNSEHFVGFNDPDVSVFSEGLIDHTPRRYAVLLWNSLVGAAVPAGIQTEPV